MKPHEFSELAVSRRALLSRAMLLGAGLAISPRLAFAAASAETAYPHVAAMVDGYVASGKLPGMIAALGWGSQAPGYIARGTLAKGDPAPVTPDSLFRIYSMTKPVTGMAAMMLVDAGKLKLDQPLSDILPKFAKMQVQVTPDGSITDLRPAKTPITIRMLLTHSAGLGYSIIQKGPLKAAYEAAGVIPGQVSRMPIPGLDRGTPVTSLALFADRLAELPLVYEPGTRWSYSVGLDLMGRVIEVVSGKPFDRFVHDAILAPTGMTSTFFRVPESDVGRLTTNYGVMGGMSLPIDPAKTSIYLDTPPFPMGGAGLVSSPRDYDRFLTMLLGLGTIEGKRVMGEAAVRLGTGNLLPASVDTAGSMIAGAGFGAGGRVGLGWDAGTYGWGGAAGTIGFVNYRVGNRAALYTQYMPSEAYPVHSEFPKAVVEDLRAMKAAA
ncbi:serine hydrolase domain-containing protein [Novosphingobium lentum]|uniref:serine hydrolase domain-containing protein n=1 Tax=Novosphingobium lentum TaxID=145287 RepID=UPI00082B77DC|nr:serine hydrolase domain-containing protein [Novosphingobium lentum]